MTRGGWVGIMTDCRQGVLCRKIEPIEKADPDWSDYSATVIECGTRFQLSPG